MYLKKFLLFCLLSLYAYSEQVAICVVLPVRNHEAEVYRCLKNVENIADYLMIFDLGSNDKTFSYIESFISEIRLPCKVFRHDAFDLNKSMECAQVALRENNFNLDRTYFLVIKPEMLLEAAPHFDKQSLSQDAYTIRENSHFLGYSSNEIHLLRASLPWKCAETFRENWVCGREFSQGTLTTLKIDSFEEASRVENFLQNSTASNDARDIFYLAQVQKALRNYQEALNLFEKCMQFENENEAQWFSKYMVADCYERMGDWEKALHAYLECFQANPYRLEPLQKIATFYRLRGKNDLACLFAKYGSLFPLSNNAQLMPFPPLNPYQFDEELSISAYYTAIRQDGYNANDQLILRKGVPWYVKSQAYNNHMFYMSPLPHATYMPIEFELPQIEEDSSERFHPMNPSIEKTESGYKVICRTVNYTQTGARFFNTIQRDGIFRTRNFLLDYNRDFQLIENREIIECLGRPRYPAFNIEGLDDCRIFTFRDHLWFTCTTSDTNATGNFQISLCKLSQYPMQKKIFIENLTPLLGPDPFRCEKNWLPFVKEDALHAIYSYDPFTIFKVDPETGDCHPVKSEHYTLDFSLFRGSAAPIPFKEGYLVLVHEVFYLPDYARCYLHRFLYLDRDLTITKLSKPFYFRHLGIEFCCSMVADHSGNQLVLGVGDEDREALLCFVPMETVASLLEDLPRLP